MPPEIRFHSFDPVDEKVVRGLVPARTIIVVNGFLGVIVIDKKVSPNRSICHVHRRIPVSVRREKRLPVPGIKRSVITALAACRENEVLLNYIATTESIIRVDSRARSVEKNVPDEVSSRSFRLHKKG